MTQEVPAPHSGSGARRPAVPARLWVLIGAIAATGAVLYFAWVRHLAGLDAPIRIPWWVLAASFGLAEVLVVHLEFREDAHTFSLSEIATVLALFFSSPTDLVLGQVVGVAVALTVYRRQRPEKLAFNLAQFALQACLASTVFHAIGHAGDPLGPTSWAAALAATLGCLLVSDVLINLAIRLSGGGLGVRRGSS